MHLLGRLSHLMGPTSRTKRGLIDGLGTVVKFIAGNPDANDLKQIERDISILKENQQILNNNMNETITKVEIRMISIRKDLEKLFESVSRNKANVDILTNLVLIEDIINILELGVTLAKPGIACKDIFDESQDVESIIVYTAHNIIHFVAKIAELKTIGGNAYNIIPFPNSQGQILDIQKSTILIKDSWYAYPNDQQCRRKDQSIECRHVWWKDATKTPDCIHQALHLKSNYTCLTMTVPENEIIEAIGDGRFLLFSKERQRATIKCIEAHYENIEGSHILQLEPGCELTLASFSTKVITVSKPLFEEEVQQIQMHLKKKENSYHPSTNEEEITLQPLNKATDLTSHLWIPSIWTIIITGIILSIIGYSIYHKRTEGATQNNTNTGITSYTLSSLLRGEVLRNEDQNTSSLSTAAPV